MKKWPELRFLFGIVFTLICLNLPLWAQLKDFTIHAEKVSYEKGKQRIEAEGSVEVTYKDLFISSQHLIYDTSAETVSADHGFTLSYEGISVEGDSLNYSILSREGHAEEVKFLYQGVELSGGGLDLNTEKLQLKNASFTTCDNSLPHYRVTATDITLYPKYGWLVAYWGFFWLGSVPMVPMPTYIYDFRAQEKARKNLPPFPEIGSNADDGNFISERLAWHLRRELSGTYTLSYAANKGLGGGMEADYLLNDLNQGDLRLYGNRTDGLFGGITHHYSFGQLLAHGQNPSFGFFSLPRLHQYELETTLSSRERINYQRVSYTPDIILRSNKLELGRREALCDFELFAGAVAEEKNTRLLRGGGKFRFYGEFPETRLGYITPALVLNSQLYSNGTRWVRHHAGLDLEKPFSKDLLFSLGYLHYLYLEGLSPFNYELYHYRGADRLTSALVFNVQETGAKLSATYFLDTWTPEDIDYSLFFKLHCYNLSITYRSLRQELTLGFSLAANH